jgi:hypothetical protein
MSSYAKESFHLKATAGRVNFCIHAVSHASAVLASSLVVHSSTHLSVDGMATPGRSRLESGRCFTQMMLQQWPPPAGPFDDFDPKKNKFSLKVPFFGPKLSDKGPWEPFFVLISNIRSAYRFV